MSRLDKTFFLFFSSFFDYLFIFFLNLMFVNKKTRFDFGTIFGAKIQTVLFMKRHIFCPHDYAQPNFRIFWVVMHLRGNVDSILWRTIACIILSMPNTHPLNFLPKIFLNDRSVTKWIRHFLAFCPSGSRHRPMIEIRQD